MDAAQIEQMNKVRLSLGMEPLPVPGGSGPQFKSKVESDSASESDELGTVDKRQAAAGSNWQKLETQRLDKIDRQKRKEAAKKQRDAQQRYAKMEGKGLGDADAGEELDTRSWLLQQKKRQKKIDKARKMEEELAAREQQEQYTSKDLAGVKVGHEMNQFDEITGEQILTLKDAEIGEESDDDELENADMKSKEQLEDRLKLKKKRPDYDPTDQEEARNVLSKYDEEIDGKKKQRFTLDGKGNTEEVRQKALDLDGEVKSKGIKINLDMFKDDAPISDYVDSSTLKVKKPKKSKKEKRSRQKVADEDDIVLPPTAPKPETDAMEVDGVQQNGVNNESKKRAFDFDDEDLQTQLAQQRRQALKKRKRMDATELARQMREEMPVDHEEPEDGGMTLDETTEFVANLKKPEAPEARAERQSKTPQPATAASPEAEEDEDGDAKMQSYAEVDDTEERRKRESATPAADITATGLEDEQSMSGAGIGASLKLLRERGLVAKESDAGLSERERQRTSFLAEKQHLIDDFDRRAREQRELDRKRGIFDKMSNREREQYAKSQNDNRERYLNQLLDDSFKQHYKPNVELRYTDEFGRNMNQKEAFKHMSHMFHGKGSGKQKTEKRLKKIEDEKSQMSRGVLGVGGDEGGFSNVQGREGKRQKQAGVRLQ